MNSRPDALSMQGEKRRNFCVNPKIRLSIANQKTKKKCERKQLYFCDKLNNLLNQ